MNKFATRLLTALLTFLLGLGATALCFINRSSFQSTSERREAALASEEKVELKVEIPDDTWVPIFFETIDKRAAIAKLPKLRAVSLPKDDVEVRVWAGFGLSVLEGFVLKRSGGRWSAIHLDGIHPRLPRSEYQKALQARKSGWEGCWRRLVEAGILTLPDGYQINCNPGAIDGMSYVVEYNVDNKYRTYMYENPKYSKCDESKRMMKIGEIIADEFWVAEFSVSR